MQPGFEERAVAFLDVLAFKDLVLGAETMPHKFTRLMSLKAVLDSHVRWDNEGLDTSVPESIKPRYIFISDSIIITSRLRDGHHSGFIAVTLKSIEIAHKLLETGFLVRGGLSVGPVFHDERNIFGSGYVSAYLAETTTVHPRVVLTREAKAYLQNDKAIAENVEFGRLVGEYEGASVVETLNSNHVQHVTEFGRIESAYKQYRAHIYTNLQTLSLGSPARSKWEWMAGFFNRAIGKFSVDIAAIDVLPVPDI